MQPSPPSGVRHLLPPLLTLCLTAAACSDSGDLDNGGAPVAPEPTVVASTLEADLAAVGIDAANPPMWADVAEIWESHEAEGHAAVYRAAKPIMELFGKSLGIKCEDCHTEIDPVTHLPVVPEDRTNLVIGMWDEWVHGLRLKNGGPLFCDSCHQGKPTLLPRGDNEMLASWMEFNFVSNFTRADGQEQSCASCHGHPFQGTFLSAWEKGEYPSTP